MAEPFLSEIRIFSFNFPPKGWALCNGQILPINQNQALFSLLGTMFGGDGRVTFALPDLRGRTAIGSGQGPGLSNRLPGEEPGVENVTLNPLQLPTHDHTAPVPGGVTGITGGNQPFDNMQPSLGLNYLINLQGIFPTSGSASEDGYLGEVTMFAGTFAPIGTHFADGSLLPINQNQALFALLGTSYGGNGTTNFSLPDLRGRALLGSGSNAPILIGNAVGAEGVTLLVSQLPPHDHSLPEVPEPSSFVLFTLGLLGLVTLPVVRARAPRVGPPCKTLQNGRRCNRRRDTAVLSIAIMRVRLVVVFRPTASRKPPPTTNGGGKRIIIWHDARACHNGWLDGALLRSKRSPSVRPSAEMSFRSARGCAVKGHEFLRLADRVKIGG
jgi:microcystin-dependent protein